MKKKFASILITLTCVLGLGVAARATTRNEIVVTLPFEFVVSGKTLPAGTYSRRMVIADESLYIHGSPAHLLSVHVADQGLLVGDIFFAHAASLRQTFYFARREFRGFFTASYLCVRAGQ